MTGYVLDTDTCVFLSTVTKAELLYGVRRSVKHGEQLPKLLEFFGWFVSLPFDDDAAERYAELRAVLSSTGKLIGPNDLLIASIAVSRSMTLVTHNTGEFCRVPGLALEDWSLAGSASRG